MKFALSDYQQAGKANWTWLPGYHAGREGFYLFRKKFTCKELEQIEIYVAGDCRFKLYLDGRLIGSGPVKSFPLYTQLLRLQLEVAPGEHLLAAEVIVWPEGWRNSPAPWSEMHIGGGFYLSGGSPTTDLSTPKGWKCMVDVSRRTLDWADGGAELFPAGPRDCVDFRKSPGDWKELTFDDSGWPEAVVSGIPAVWGNSMGDLNCPWQLEMPQVAHQRFTPEPIAAVRHLSNPKTRVTLSANGTLTGTIPAGKSLTVLKLNRYFTGLVHLAGLGAGGTIKVILCEALAEDGKTPFRVQHDLLSITPEPWSFDSFEMRAGQHLALECNLDAPLTVTNLALTFQTYDFGEFQEYHNPQDPELERIYQVGIHTAKCCAHDTYEDCPYFERLQYSGDSRIQALISYEATGHGALGRKALRDFQRSLLPCGLTRSRFPDILPQVIPCYSLIWILMVEDYDNYFHDSDIVKECYTAMRSVLTYFENRIEPATGLSGNPGFWDFTDWQPEWPSGESTRKSGLPPTINNLFFILALKAMTRFAIALGETADELRFTNLARRLADAINAHCYDTVRQSYTDVPGKPWYSLQVNALAILAEVATADRLAAAHALLLADAPDVTRCSLYFQFYVLEALRKLGDRDGMYHALTPWRESIRRNPEITTFPEVPDPASNRSACHAWSAGPVYEILVAKL